MIILLTISSILVTICIYMVSRILGKKYPSPLTTPVFFSTAILVSLLGISNFSYEQYEPAKEIITYFLGPATVALAVPIYKNRQLIVRYSFIGGLGLVLGSIATIVSIIVIAKLFHFTERTVASLSVKSATVPIAVEVTEMINGDPSLAAVFVVVTGTVGAMIGPWLLDQTKIKNPISRGLSMGTIAHGIGTAEISREGQLQGAISGLAMSLAAIFMSMIIPLLFKFL